MIIRTAKPLLAVVAFLGAGVSATATAANWTGDAYTVAAGDFNNDGRADLLVIAKDPALPSGIALGDGSGQPSVFNQTWASGWLGLTWSGDAYLPLVGDFNGDSYDDVFLQRASSGNHYVLLNDTTGRLTQIHQTVSNSYLGVSWSQVERRIVVGDFNNIGGDDLFLQANGTAADNVVALSSISSTPFLSVSPPTPWANWHLTLEWSLTKAVEHAGDFDGDGYADWFVHAKPNWVLIPYQQLSIPVPVYRPASYGIALADGTGRAATLGQAWNRDYLGLEWSPLYYDAIVADFGGDDCADILLQAKRAGGASRMIISQCGPQPFASATVHVLAAGVTWDQTSYQLRAGDFNGDGRADLYMQAMAGGTNRIAYTDTNGNVTATPVVHAPSGNFKKPVPGAVPGNFAVGDQGEGTYAIPIDMPAATGGLKPSLVLTYNHLAGSGLAGMGWGLAGLSAITRCGRTYAQDGSVVGISYTNADAFCLNGQRLVAINGGAHGATATEYRTEIETFQRIVQLDVQGGGPHSFRVDHGNGLSSHFGVTEDSRIEITGGGAGAAVKLWYISYTEDRFGNRVKYTYTENNTTGETVPNEVLWTERVSAPTLAPKYKATIVYENRPADDVRTGHDSAGKGWVATKRIDRIDVFYNSTQLIHSYDLTYAAAGPTGRSRLRQVQVCGPNECLPPTTFTVQSATSGWSAAVDTGFTSGSGPVFAGDFNGDVRQDLIVVIGGNWHVYRGNAAGSLDAAVNTGISAGPNPYTARVFDYDSNGTDRLLYKSSTDWKVLGTNGTTYWATNTTATTPTDAVILDYDGDGAEDWLYREGAVLKWRRNTGAGFAAAQSLSGFTGDTLYQHAGRRAPDFNGDGRGDLIQVGQHCAEWPPYGTLCTPVTTILVASGTSGFTATAQLEGDLFAGEHIGYVNAVELNGDGLDDLAYVVSNATTQWWYTRLSTGPGFDAGSTTGVPGASGQGSTFADYDSDGREDLVYAGGSTLYVHRSNGTTFGGQTASLSSAGLPGAADVSGDGFDDLIVAPLGGTLRIHKHQTALPDVVTSVTDGLGYYVGVQYESLVNSASYTVSGAAPTSIYTHLLKFARHAVTAETHDNGIGGTRTFNHLYDTAYVDVSGRGWLAFATHRVNDLARGTSVVTEYSQAFPNVGRVTKRQLKRSSDNQLIREVVNDVQATALTGTPNRQFVRTEKVTTKEYEVGGAANNQHLRTIEVDPVYDQTYGYLTSTTRTVSNLAATETWMSATVFTRPATPLTTPWCLDVPDLVETTNTLVPAASTAPSRKTRYTRNATTCAVTETRDESDANQAKQLKTAFTYDPYGNLDVTTLDDFAGPATARTTDLTFDANGQFLASVTVGGVNLTTQMTFNPLFGTRASVTGPDGLATSFLYDDFGRVTKETRPAGYTNFAYDDCYYCWPLNARLSVRAQGSDGSDAYQFYDEQQRPVGASWTLPQGHVGRRETRYDALGQAWKTSQPYVSTDPAVYWVEYERNDLLGRLTKETAPESEAQPTGRTTTYEHRGLERWVTDDKTHTTKYVENAAGQIRQVVDALNHATSYTYKPFGELATVLDVESNSTTIGYDARGFKSSMADPNMGNWSYDSNVFGELASQTNGASQTVTLAYDTAGRLDTRSEVEGTTKFTYHASGVLGMGGKPNEICVWSGTACLTSHKEKYTYDAVTGQPSQIRRTLDGTLYDFDFAFDSQGRLDVMSYPAIAGYRFKVDYDYDAAGELSLAKDGNTAEIFYVLSQTDALNRDTFVTLGNGLVERRSFDRASGHLTAIDTGPSETSTIQDLSFTWDEVGNLATRQSALKTETFVYDALDRLDTAQVSGGGVLNDVNYSDGGRITSKTGVGPYTYTGGSCGGGPGALKNAGGQNYCYDSNGRMTSHGTDTFVWYSYDLPKKLAVGTKTAEFSYGVGRERYKQIQKTGSTTDATIYYAGTLYEKETAGATTTHRHYVPVRDRVIAQVSRVGTTNTVRYLHRDHQESVVEVTNGSGGAVQSLSFDAWGLRRNAANWAALGSPFGGSEPTERGYTGHEHLDRVELIHMNGRVQDPKLGLFISADPLVTAPYHSQSLNRYSYVWNNPMTLLDPSGFQVQQSEIRLPPGECELRNYDCRDRGAAFVCADLSNCWVDSGESIETGGYVFGREDSGSGGSGTGLMPQGGQNSNNQLTWFENLGTSLDLPSMSDANRNLWMAQLDVVSWGLATPISGLIHGQPVVDTRSQGYAMGVATMGAVYVPLTAGTGALSGGTAAVGNTAARTGTTSLFRAVGPDELADLGARAGAFRNPAGIEVKYFAETAEGATSYAQQAYRARGSLYQGPYTIVRTDLASDLVTPIMRATTDRGISTITVPTPLLPRLSPAQALPATPLP